MTIKHHQRLLCLLHPRRLIITGGLIILFPFIISTAVIGQQKTLDNQTFTRYKPGYFKPRRGLNYTFFFVPLITVDPLGIGGKSTYALSAVSNIRLWGSKLQDKALQGLKINEWYTSVGYEFYPQQFDNIFASIGFKVKTFMPLEARMDAIYSYGYGLAGTSTRFCVGFQIRKVTIFMCGVTSGGTIKYFGEHPYQKSPYANVGNIIVMIPIHSHEVKP
jgi:hypothetical protein